VGEHVEPAAGGADLGDEADRGLRLAQVAAEREVAVAGQLRDGRLRAVEVEVVRRDVGAALGERRGGRAADPAGGAGDEDRLALEAGADAPGHDGVPASSRVTRSSCPLAALR
jgi:hypothetical protein